MKLMIETSNVSFSVGREVQPRKDQNGVQRTTKVEDGTSVPTWSVQLIAIDGGGAEVVNVTYAGQNPPKLTVGQPVIPVGLQAIPWAQNGKNGTAFRATEFKSVAAGKTASAGS